MAQMLVFITFLFSRGIQQETLLVQYYLHEMKTKLMH